MSAEIRNLIYDHISNQFVSYSVRRSSAWSTGTITLSESATYRQLAIICVNRQICQEFLGFLFGLDEVELGRPADVWSTRSIPSKSGPSSWRSFTIRTDVSLELTNPWEIWQTKPFNSGEPKPADPKFDARILAQYTEDNDNMATLQFHFQHASYDHSKSISNSFQRFKFTRESANRIEAVLAAVFMSEGYVSFGNFVKATDQLSALKLSGIKLGENSAKEPEEYNCFEVSRDIIREQRKFQVDHVV